MIFHDAAKFGGHRHCSSSDIIFFLIFHVTSGDHDHVLKGLCEFMDGSLSQKVPT